MLTRIRSRLTYANVTATLALFLALGGGAWAATGFVTASGVIHACAARNGSLTLVKSGKRCGRGKTAIAWNQRGAPGVAGASGLQGAKGDQGPKGEAGSNGGEGPQGPPGPGAISFNVHKIAPFSGSLETIDGVIVYGFCVESEPVEIGVKAEKGTVSASGDRSGGEGSLMAVQESAPAIIAEGLVKADFDAIATVNETWSRFDLGGFKSAGACNFWGLITPGG